MADPKGTQNEFEMYSNETQEEYVKRSFWGKVKQTAAKVPFIPDAVAMYYTMLDMKTPLWAKLTIVAALAYFIAPIDAIPDMIPIAGFTDDAGAVMAAVTAVSSHITNEHRQKAQNALNG